MSQGKYSKNAVLSRKTLSVIFTKKNKRPDAECWELENFVVSTVARFDLEKPNFTVTHAGDVYELVCTCGVTPKVWQQWFAQRQNGWPVVKQQNGISVWAWFQSSHQMGEWVAVGELCPIIYTLVRRKDARGFNKVG